MCNLRLGDGQRQYGRDALVAGPVHEYEVSPDYSPSPEQQAVLPFYESEEREYLYFTSHNWTLIRSLQTKTKWFYTGPKDLYKGAL